MIEADRSKADTLFALDANPFAGWGCNHPPQLAVRDKARFAEHWDKDLDVWFEDGIDTPGLVMIHVKAERIHYWDGKDDGEVVL